MPNSAVSSPHSLHNAVCWQMDETFHCSIHSDDADILDYTARVLVASASNGAKQRLTELSWSIKRPCDNDSWFAQPLNDSTPEFREETLATLLTSIEYGALQQLLSRGTESFFSLHAALLTKNERSVVIVGPKEAGKSTLACALWAQCDWTLRSDDSALVDTNNKTRPAPRRVSLRNGSRPLLGDGLWNRLSELPSTYPTNQGMLFHPHELENRSAPEAAHIPSAVFFLARRESTAGSAETVAIAPALAALALLPYSTFLLPRGEQLLCPSRVDWGSSLPRLTAFAARVPMFDLGRGPLDAMTREVERLVFHANPIATSNS